MSHPNCPFCGGAPTVEEWHGGNPGKTMVSCASTDCYVNPMVTGENEHEALARWEKRAEPDPTLP